MRIILNGKQQQLTRELSITQLLRDMGIQSEAAEAMEMGAAAVLVNTAIASSSDAVDMGKAFGLAVQAGRLAYLSGPGAVKEYAQASSPLTGFLTNKSRDEAL